MAEDVNLASPFQFLMCKHEIPVIGIVMWQGSPEVDLSILIGSYLVHIWSHGVFHLNSHKPCTLSHKSGKIKSKKVRCECHIINHRLTLLELYWGILVLRCSSMDLTTLSLYCQNLRPVFPCTALILD